MKKKYGGKWLIFRKNGRFVCRINERAEPATSSYSVTGDSLHYLYSVPVTKNHWNIQSRYLVHESSFTDTF